MKHGSYFSKAVRLFTTILVGILLLPLAPEQPKAAVQAWTRTLDPVIVTGNQLSLFTGVALDDLFVYAYNGSTWSVVPFQFDEVKWDGEFLPYENGYLDANDQLAFMAADLGDMATVYEWPANVDSRNYSRYEVHVTNPLNPSEEGWVYVYRSTTLAPTFAPYVTWNGASNTIAADTYTTGYAPLDHLGIDSLQLNGYPGDVLDRSKFRLQVFCIDSDGGENISLIVEDSEEVIDSWDPPDIYGPVRVGGGTLDEYSWSYASMFTDESTFTIGDVDPEDCTELRYDFFRASEDWLDPSTSGMAPMTYFDSVSPAGVPVDGTHEYIPPAPFPTWRQVSGAKGSVVQAMDIDAGGSTLKNYYNDGYAEDIETGDGLHFGDAGFEVAPPLPIDTVLISTAHYVLGPSQPAVGGTYREFFDNPLQATATAQDYSDPAPHAVTFTYSPKPTFLEVETTLTASVDGLEPFTYDWQFGDDGSFASGNPVPHTFTMTGAVPVTLTVTNAYDDATLVWPVFVFDPDGPPPPIVYLPLVLRNAQ